jgi:sugar lactone lactonase YvrE
VRTTFVSGLSFAVGLAFDTAGNLFVADSGSGSILKLTPGGARSTFVSGLDGPEGLAFDKAGNLFVTDGGSIAGPGHGHLYKFTPNGVRSILGSGFISPNALAFDSTGNLFLVDAGDIDGLGDAIYKFTPNGVRTTFGPTNFGFEELGLAIDSANNLFVPDYEPGNIYKFTPAGVHSVFVNIPSNFQSGVAPAALAFEPTLTGPPIVTTNPAALIASFSATLNGSLNPHGLSTTFHFQYGATTSYGLTTALQTQTGNTSRNVSANISSLTANTTYHFRIVASNANDTRMGADRVFTTLAMTGAPVVMTNPATFIASFSATLNGSLNPNGLPTTFHFQYGTTTNYGLTTAPQTRIGNTSQPVTANIIGLTAGTTYHFRIVASNADGTSYGSDKTFTTLIPTPTGPPIVTTNSAYDGRNFSVIFNGTVDPNGLTTTVYFQYGTTTSYGYTTASQTKTGNTSQSVSSTIGWAPGPARENHFRIVGTNRDGTTYGDDKIFYNPCCQ